MESGPAIRRCRPEAADLAGEGPVQLLIDDREHPVPPTEDGSAESALRAIRMYLRSMGRWPTSFRVHGLGSKRLASDILLVEIQTRSVSQSFRAINECLRDLLPHGSLLCEAAALAIGEGVEEVAEAIEEAVRWWSLAIESCEALEAIGEDRYVPLIQSAYVKLTAAANASSAAELERAFEMLAIEAEKWERVQEAIDRAGEGESSDPDDPEGQ